jgi:hypothetical protein
MSYRRNLRMKAFGKIALAVLVLVLATGISAWAQASSNTYVDAYTSASETKATLAGDAFEAAAKALEAGSSDLANAAKAKTAGYVAPKSYIGNVMSTNPDGSVGISTISQWSYAAKGGKGILTVQLTHGQNAVNLADVGRRGSLYVPGVAVNGKSGKYLVHFKVASVDVLKYSDEAFNAGKFNSYYSGKAGKKSQYTMKCDVLAIEEVSESVKLGVVF